MTCGGEFLNFLEGGQIVFVDVDDYVRRVQLAQNIELDILRAADLRHVAHGVARMNTESGAANHLRVEAKAEEELGDRRYQRDDARVCVGARMHVAGGIDTARPKNRLSMRASFKSGVAGARLLFATGHDPIEQPARHQFQQRGNPTHLPRDRAVTHARDDRVGRALRERLDVH